MKERDRFRKIHLDFHTSPLITDIASEFDAAKFSRTFSGALVDSVVVFAKCHHGMSYYDTNLGIRHPHLKIDLLGEMLAACHQRNIKVSAYYSVCWDNEIVRQHPEWLELADEGVVSRHGTEPKWSALCIGSPYVDEIVMPQTEELLRKYDLDGIWYDIVWVRYNKCFCSYCLAGMKKAGLDYRRLDDQARYSQRKMEVFMDKTSRLIHRLKPAASIDYNSIVKVGIGNWAKYPTNVEIEALPHGWGYFFCPLLSRHARTTGLDYTGITARFHKGWADFGSLKSAEQLKYETATMVANGAHCSIGDQLHPRGTLDESAYRNIGEAYRHIAACEKWLHKAKSVAEIAVVGDSVTGCEVGMTDAIWGAGKILIETHHQFDIIDEQGDFNRYRLLILPGNRKVDRKVAGRIVDYVEKGGSLIVAENSSLNAGGFFELKEILGVEYAGPSDYSLEYLDLRRTLQKGIPPLIYVVYDRFTRVSVLKGTKVLADTVSPYFERTAAHFTSHHHAPADKKAAYPGITRRGNCVYIAPPIFKSYFNHGNAAYRNIVRNCIDLLLPGPLVRTDAPTWVEVTLTEQKGRRIVHLVNYHAEKRGNNQSDVIEQIPPVTGLTVDLRSGSPPRRVYVAPQGGDVNCQYEDGYAQVKVAELDIHTMLVFE